MRMSAFEFVANIVFATVMISGLMCALLPKWREAQLLRWARNAEHKIMRSVPRWRLAFREPANIELTDIAGQRKAATSERDWAQPLKMSLPERQLA